MVGVKLLAAAVAMLFVTLAPGPAHAASSRCRTEAALPAPQMNVVEQDVTARYDFSQDANEIHQIAVRSNTVEDSGTILVRGLTVARFGWKVDGVRVRFYRPDMGEGWCTYPDSMTLTIGYADPLTVYVQDNYPQGSCQSNAILEHENTHVRIMSDGLRAHMPAIRAAVTGAITDQALPIWSADHDGGAARIMQQIKNKIDDGVADMMADEQAQHAILDGEASKARTRAECLSW